MLNLRSPAGFAPELLPWSSVFVRVVVALLGTAVLSALGFLVVLLALVAMFV